MAQATTRGGGGEADGQGSLGEAARTLALLVGLFFINMLSRLGMGPLLPQVEADLGIGHAQAGGFFLFISLGYCASLLGSVYLSARFTHHRIVMASGFTVGLALLVAALSPGLGSLRLAMVLLGMADGFYLPSGVATITAIIRRGDWGKALAVHQLAPNLAYVAAPFFAWLAAGHLAWRELLAVYGVVSLLLTLAYIRWGRGACFRGKPLAMAYLREFLSRRSLWILIGLFSLAMGTNQGIFAMLPLYLNHERGWDLATTNQLLAASRLAALFMPLLGGWFSDRLGVRPALRGVILGSGLATVALAFLPGNWMTPFLFLQAMATVSFFPIAFQALALITPPEQRNLAVALTVPMGHLLGAGLVPAGVGWLGEMGVFGLGMGLMGILTLAGLLFTLGFDLGRRD